MAMSKVLVFVVMMVAVWQACNGSCNLNIQDLMKCKEAVTLSNPTAPTPLCCNMVKGLNSEDIKCLCDYKTNQGDFLQAIGVDADRCTQLPKMCGLSKTAHC